MSALEVNIEEGIPIASHLQTSFLSLKSLLESVIVGNISVQASNVAHIVLTLYVELEGEKKKKLRPKSSSFTDWQIL